MKGRSESLVASALLHFVHSTSRGAALCYYLCYVFVWPHRPTAVLFLINATHSSYLSSVTTIILPTSLGSVPNAGKKNIIREVSSFHPGVSPLLRSAPLCYCDSLNNFLLLFCLSDPFDSLFSSIDALFTAITGWLIRFPGSSRFETFSFQVFVSVTVSISGVPTLRVSCLTLRKLFTQIIFWAKINIVAFIVHFITPNKVKTITALTRTFLKVIII